MSDDRLRERLRALAQRAGRDEGVRNQCRATSRAGGRNKMYGRDEVYRCQKEARHRGRHEDYYGTQGETEPRFKILVQRGPRESPATHLRLRADRRGDDGEERGHAPDLVLGGDPCDWPRWGTADLVAPRP
ncbi:hypothetical protein [Kribbella sp. NPDC004536]|uniref:hypothetical protein n=1 Tax=Kribbella sp. NPDC004536 TaxID=3364106 RepID=UPI0036AD9FCB